MGAYKSLSLILIFKLDLNHPHINRAPVAQLVEHRAVTREVVSSTPAGPTLGL